MPVDNLNQPVLEQNNQSTEKTAVLLLPLHGAFADAGQTIRDGFLTAHRSADSAHAANIQVIDTQNYATPQDAYQAAVALHPDLIVGPLLKAEVNALLSVAPLPVTTLALNQIDPDALLPTNLFTFSLDPQAEARDTAEKIYAAGYRHVFVIAPSDEWEQAIVFAFNQAWLEAGGMQTDDLNYDQTTDIASAIQEITKDQTEDMLKQTAVFCIVSSEKAATMIPIIKNSLPNMPIYATPMIFNGSNQAALENVTFEVSPWILDPQQVFRNELMKSDPNISFAHIGLNAFGADAWALTQSYLKTGSFDNLALQAYSGYLTLSAQNSVQRQLTWGIVKNATLIPLPADPQRSSDET